MEALLISALGSVILFMLLAIIIAVPFAITVFGYKKGVYLLAGLNIAVAGVFASLWGLLTGLCVLLVLLPFTYIMLYCIQQKINLVRSVAIGTFVLTVSLVVIYFIIEKNSSGIVIETVKQYINELVPQIKEYLASFSTDMGETEIADIMLESVYMAIPTVLIVPSFVLSLATYAFAVSYLNSKENAQIPYIKFELWDFSQRLGCFMLIAFLAVYIFWSLEFAWAESLFLLLISLYTVMLGVHGMSCLYFFAKQYRLSSLLAIVLIFILLAIAPMVVIIFGFIDKLFKIRLSYMIRHGMVKVRNINNIRNNSDDDNAERDENNDGNDDSNNNNDNNDNNNEQ